MSYFTIKELSNSSTAKKLGIDNTPTPEIRAKLNTLISVLDKIREQYGKPITVTSGYRCPELNKAVGGAVNPDGTPKSQHCKGEAADLVGANKAETKKIFEIAKELGNYDQLLFETNKAGSVWVHISYKASGNRKMCIDNYKG
ncbi:MAG TPA: D-Ala-D-Ala carboxypeptidase family metallohydrolase [Paludibacteraceae bacterium]|nr:D-Ala-D-Ala carboxypeptidase family metallohydrolase [Paludibacteraceae bacterium]